MLAAWYGTWDTFPLFMARLTLVSVLFVGVLVIRKARTSARLRGPSALVVPTVWNFTLSWLVLFLVTAFVYLVSGVITLGPIVSTIYVTALVWTLGGLFWVIAQGSKQATSNYQEFEKGKQAHVEAMAEMQAVVNIQHDALCKTVSEEEESI